MSRCRLIYKSISTEEVIANETLQNIACVSAENNKAHGITGLLLLSGDRFLQVLEGPAAAVNRLYNKITQDPRHRQVQLISYEPIGPSYFSNWSMRELDLYNLPGEPRKLLADKYEHNNGVIKIPKELHMVFALLLDAKSICEALEAAQS